MQSSGVLRAKLAVNDRKTGKELLALDIKNAYNSLPHSIITNMLDANGIAKVNKNYII